MRRRTLLAVAALVVAGSVAAAGVAVAFGGGEPSPAARVPRPPATAEVTEADLVDYVEIPGVLGFGGERPLRYTPPPPPDPPPPDPPPTGDDAGGTGDLGAAPPAEDLQGLVTWLPAVGATVRRGGVLFRVDNAPVVLLVGDVPVYRSMRAGVRGPDVRMLERNLRALGYTGFTVDDAYTGATAGAVRRWQKDLEVTPTGVLAPGRALVERGAVRVAAHALRVGDRADAEVLRVTGTARTVVAELEARQAAYARKGLRATVELPDGRTADGVVAAIGAAAGAAEAGAAAEAAPPGRPQPVPIRVTIEDQAAVRDVAPGPVRVRLVATERRDVLTVPVPALVALAEGSFGVEVVEGNARRYVAVQTGLFAAGRVEVSAPGLRPGMLVVVPK